MVGCVCNCTFPIPYTAMAPGDTFTTEAVLKKITPVFIIVSFLTDGKLSSFSGTVVGVLLGHFLLQTYLCPTTPHHEAGALLS